MWVVADIFLDMKRSLYEHIEYLDWHSAREGDKAIPFKWNTPIANEFIDFGVFIKKKMFENMLDPEIIARYGKTQEERMAINNYIRFFQRMNK